MKKHFQYLWYVLKHKWHVFVECCKDGMVWRGIVHDISKFSPTEWAAYAEWTFGKRKEVFVSRKMKRGDLFQVDYDKEYIVMKCKPFEFGDGWIIETLPISAKRAFDLAILHHYAHNQHHWNHWVMQTVRVDNWHIQEMSIESPKVIAQHGVPLLWCEADSRWGDDVFHSQASRMIKMIVDKLNVDPVCLPMSDVARREMLADLRAAGRSYRDASSAKEYYEKHGDKFILHSKTRQWLEDQLGASDAKQKNS